MAYLPGNFRQRVQEIPCKEERDKGILINPVNMRESKLQKEIREKIKESQPDADLDSIKIVVNAVTDLPSNQDHNYQFYCANFQRALRMLKILNTDMV